MKTYCRKIDGFLQVLVRRRFERVYKYEYTSVYSYTSMLPARPPGTQAIYNGTQMVEILAAPAPLWKLPTNAVLIVAQARQIKL
jgi:hypothetical protein